ncbi:MAG: HD domain-containing protein [Leptospira sp.]|nr:HD domain-containing protein [Leptospira sp.]
MKKLKVSDIKKGDRFSKPVYLDKDTVLVSSQSPITENDLERLRKFGISEVFCDGEKINSVKDDANPLRLGEEKLPFLDQSEDGMRLKVIYDKITHNRYEFDSIYVESLQEVQTAYKLIAEGKSFEIQKFRTVAERMVDFTKGNFQTVAIYLTTNSQNGYYLYHQVVNSTFYSLMLSCYLDYSRPKMIDLCLAGLMADAGMALIPSHISEKGTVYDENDTKTVKKHTLVGYQVLTQKIKLKNTLAIIALQHHENYDGSGYPQRLATNSIEEFARIYAISDNYAALTSRRPYRKAFLPHEAIKKMIGELVNKFDLKLVRLFLNVLSMYPLGSYVELSDGRIGMVIESNRDKPIRPSVRIIKESGGQKIRTLQFCNLGLDVQLYIVKPVDVMEANQ